MAFNLLIGLTGIILAIITIVVLGRIKVTHPQRILVFMLSSLTFVFYLIFGIFDFSTEVGSELNLGLFQISYGISESILILLVLILPMISGLCLMFSLKNFNWVKRFAVPFLLIAFVILINFFQTFREFEQHRWDFEDGVYDSCLNLRCEE